MKDFEKLDQLLRQAISSNDEPDNSLNQLIIRQMREKNRMKRGNRKKTPAAIIFAILVIVTSVSAFAAWQLLTPKQVAENLGDKSLAIAFEGKDALAINQTQVSGDYKVSLLGIVSGKELSDFKHSAEDIYPDRTYAVVAIAKANGAPMPGMDDPEYDEVSFLVSPFIKGQNPKDMNIFTMNGGYSAFIKDGIMYRIVECDGIEIFADRGLYIGVISNTFYDINAYNFDSETGEISPNADYKGVNLLFDLPIDPSKGDYEKAEKYIQTLFDEQSSGQKDIDEGPVDLETLLIGAALIPESVQEIAPDKEGIIAYGFDGHETRTPLEILFDEGQVGFSNNIYMGGDEHTKNIIVFSKDADGVIKGMTYRKDNDDAKR